jgi:hypothetical protein
MGKRFHTERGFKFWVDGSSKLTLEKGALVEVVGRKKYLEIEAANKSLSMQ